MKNASCTDRAKIPQAHAEQAIDYIFRAAHASRRHGDPTAAIWAYEADFKELGYSWHPDEGHTIRRKK